VFERRANLIVDGLEPAFELVPSAGSAYINLTLSPRYMTEVFYTISIIIWL